MRTPRRAPPDHVSPRRVEIGDLALSLPALPGVPPERLARALQAQLARIALSPAGPNHRIDNLALPPIRAMRGEGPDALAVRIADAVERALEAAEDES